MRAGNWRTYRSLRLVSDMRNKPIAALLLIVLALVIVIMPLLLIKGSEFEGSDTRGSEMIIEISGGEYVPWFSPLIEKLIGGELPSEMETLFFSIQTGIGVGIFAFCFGYLVARRKFDSLSNETQDNV